MTGEEQDRQVQASTNKLTPGKVERRRVHQPNKQMPGKRAVLRFCMPSNAALAV